VAEALRLAENMMRDSWATGNDAAWQPGRAALESHLDGMHTLPDVDELAQHIRWLNGNSKMGAGRLAERLLEWMALRA
jgi:hypothetical protein